MRDQLICPAMRLWFGLMMVALWGCQPAQTQFMQTTHLLVNTTDADMRLKSILAACYQEISGWTLVKNFETAHYSLVLCQQDRSLLLLGQEKIGKRLVKATAQVEQETIVAEGNDWFSYEIRQGTLTVKKRGNIVVQEGFE